MHNFVQIQKYHGKSGGWEIKTQLGIEARCHTAHSPKCLYGSAERIAKQYGLSEFTIKTYKPTWGEHTETIPVEES